jgi:formylglycine-generating enzyme required for sulfatase activity
MSMRCRLHPPVKWLLTLSTLSSALWSSPVIAERRPRQPSCVDIAIGSQVRCVAPASGRTQWFKDCPTCPELVVVPNGKFSTGSPDSELGRSPRETRARMTIAKAFAVGRFAITFDEWDACVLDGGCNGYQPADDGFGRGRNPVVRVSWFDANAYTQWLSRKTGKTYRLLASTEREYVARAGTETAYWWGDAIDLEQANYDVYDKVVRSPDGKSVPVTVARQRPVSVDSFAANPWGLYNVHGNVWEWTADCWREDGPTVAKASDKRTPDCGQRTARGGSWNDYAAEARSAASIGFGAVSRNLLQGFRVARTLPMSMQRR